jgi:RNA polymerase-binding transcription factor DksA
MAIKKKAAKPAKHATTKKAAPKKVVKSAHSAKVAPKKAAAKKPVTKVVAKKTAPAKKHVAPNKSAAKPVKKPVAAVKHAPAKAEVKKPVPKVPEKKHETAKPIPVAKKPEAKIVTPPAKPVKVVIPDMKTKTVRKYEPEFTKSVLDTNTLQEQNGPTMRYSDAELIEFRELITKKLDAAKKELAYLQGLITRKDEMGGDNDDARYMTMEDGGMSMEREQLSQMASRQITFIDHLEKAMMRIENKTYGICRVTGKLIDKARLRAVPHATLSIEAKQMMNK